ncbi:MAG TPA: 3-phenylpropionate/cinnamic acid dioxygenase subunit beta [Acidimicrobiales bacterium]|nr:3-phenylpropionate/cinnamic acid dioxygenase subunit beta [Acidimicrobiales bacterium]
MSGPWEGAAPTGIELHYEVSNFLTNEAALLDGGAYAAWLELMTEDIRYRMPVRVTVARSDADVAVLGDMAHFDEDLYSLGKRAQRLLGDHAWTEDPPSRTRRFVTNVRVATSEGSDEFVVHSYLLVFRSRLDVRPPEWVSAERRDVLRRLDGALRLARRDITADEAVLRTQNLAIFL